MTRISELIIDSNWFQLKFNVFIFHVIGEKNLGLVNDVQNNIRFCMLRCLLTKLSLRLRFLFLWLYSCPFQVLCNSWQQFELIMNETNKLFAKIGIQYRQETETKYGALRYTRNVPNLLVLILFILIFVFRILWFIRMYLWPTVLSFFSCFKFITVRSL